MQRTNKHALALRLKYGSTWNAPLFHASVPAQTPTAESDKPSPVPQLIIDDATEEKAAVYDNVAMKKETDIQRDAVLAAIKHLSEPTDNTVARFLHLVPSTVAARRNELIDRGLVLPLLDLYGKKKKKIDLLTKTPNTIWRATQ